MFYYDKENEHIKICIDTKKLAAFDDTGVSGHKSSWVLEKGIYNIHAGANIRAAHKVFSYKVTETVVIETLSERMSPCVEFERTVNNGGKPSYEWLSLQKASVSHKAVLSGTCRYEKKL